MSVKKRKTKKGKWQKVFTSRWVSIFKVVILDEGHKLRHPWMKLHVSVYQLDALVHWFLTATLITNDALDNYKSFKTVQALPKTDIRRCIIMDPKRVEALLNTQDVGLIERYYHFMDELLTIRRSITLTLMRNAQGDMISMRSMIPVHEVKTVKLDYHEEEATEAQWEDDDVDPLSIEFNQQTEAALVITVHDPLNIELKTIDSDSSRPRHSLKRYADDALQDPVYMMYEAVKKRRRVTETSTYLYRGKDIADSDKGFIKGSDQAESDTFYDGSKYEENDAVSLKSEDSDESSDSALSVEGAAEGAVEPRTEFTLKSIMMKLLRQNYVKLTVKQQEHLNPDRVYTLKDLKDTVILDRALRLLYQAHFGKERQQLRISPHINYSKLLKKVSQMIKNKYHVKEAQLQTAVKALAATMDLMNVKTVNRVVTKKGHHKDEQAPSDKYEDTTAEEGRGDEPAGDEPAGDDTTAEEGSEVSVDKDGNWQEGGNDEDEN
ncbi:hypothetical protein MMC24_007980 [Lignoscripta atroalba]|nr:hypothetical protein [Lignoscripta atroalba]